MKNNIEARLWGGLGIKKSNGGSQWYQQDRIYNSDNVAISISTCCQPYYTQHEKEEETNMKVLRIGKLTPRECFRLMGLRDDSIALLDDCEEGEYQFSDSAKYHLAGDSIVIDVLMNVFFNAL